MAAERDLKFAIKFRNEAAAAFRTLKNDIRTTSAEFGRQSATAKAAAASNETMASSLRNVGIALGGLMVTRGGFRVIGGLVSEFADVEAGLIGVAKTTDLTEKELDEFGEALHDISDRAPLATTELARIAQIGGQLGVTGVANLAKFAETVGKVTVATDLTAESAALALSRILALTDEPIEQVDRLASQFVALGNTVRASEAEIAEIARELSIALGPLEMTSTQVVGLSASFAEMGQQPQRVRTAMNKLFTAIGTGAQEGGQKLQTLAELTGVSTEGFRQMLAEVGLFETGLLVMEGFGEQVAKSSNKVAVANKLLKQLGVDAERAGVVLRGMGDQMPGIRANLAIANRELEHSIALEQEFARYADSVRSVLIVLRNNFAHVSALIGEKFSVVVRKAADGMIAFAGALQDFLKAGDGVGAWIAAITTALVVMVPLVVTLAAAWPLVAKGLLAFGAAATKAATGVGPLKAAMLGFRASFLQLAGMGGATVRFFATMTKASASFTVSLLKVGPAVRLAITAMAALKVAMVTHPYVAIAVAIATLLGLMVKYRDEQFKLGGHTVSVTSLVTAAWKEVKEMFTAIGDAIAAVGHYSEEILVMMASRISESFGKSVRSAINSLQSLSPSLDSVVNWTVRAFALVAGTIETSFRVISRTVEGAANNAKALFEAFKLAWQGDFAGAFNVLVQSVDEGMDRVKHGFQADVQELVAIVGTDYAAKIGAAAAITGEEAGKALAEGMADGVNENSDAVLDAANSLSDKFKEIAADIKFKMSLVGMDDIDRKTAEFRQKMEKLVAAGDLAPGEVKVLVDLKRTQLEEDAIEKLTDKVHKQIAALERQMEVSQASDAIKAQAAEVAARILELDQSGLDMNDEKVRALRDLIEVELSQTLLEADRAERLAKVTKSINEQIDSMREEQAVLGMTTRERELAVPVLRAMNEAKREGIELSAELIERLQKEAEALQKARDAQERGLRGLTQGFRQAYENYTSEALNFERAATDIFTRTTGAMEDALVKFFETGKFEWRDFTKVVVREIQIQIAKLIALMVVKAIATGISSVAGSSAFAGMRAGVQAPTQLPATGFDFMTVAPSGGFVTKPTLAWLGTKDKEWVIPDKHMDSLPWVKPLKQATRSGQYGTETKPVTINSSVNVVFNEQGSREENRQANNELAEQLGVVVERAIEEKVMEMQRPGNILNPTEVNR